MKLDDLLMCYKSDRRIADSTHELIKASSIEHHDLENNPHAQNTADSVQLQIKVPEGPALNKVRHLSCH